MPERPVWLFLRGLAREARHWGDFVTVFENEVPASVRVMDLPGAGEFIDVSCPKTIHGITDFLREEAQRRGLFEQPVSVLAISMGGMVAMDWMHRYPKDFKRGVIINSSASNLSPFYHRMNGLIYPKFLSAVLTRDPELREKKILSIISHDISKHKALAEKWASFYKERPMKFRNFFRQLHAASRFCSPSEIQNPILFIGCRKDRLVRPSCSKRLAESLKAPLVWHEWAGHDLPVDDGKWLANLIKTWITQGKIPSSAVSQMI